MPYQHFYYTISDDGHIEHALQYEEIHLHRLLEVQSPMASLIDMIFEDSGADPEWILDEAVVNAVSAMTYLGMSCFSLRELEEGLSESRWSVLAYLGEYAHGTPMEEETMFNEKYKDKNWHAKFWTLLSQEVFSRPTPGPTSTFGEVLPKFI